MSDCATPEHQHGYMSDKVGYQNRLKRIEGQVRGLQRLIEEEQYCIDIITQVSAVNKALEKISLGLLEDHLRHCVAEASNAGGQIAEEKILEASAAIARMMR